MNSEGRDARGQVLHVAGHFFLTRGYAATTTQQIVSTAGVAAPTLYWHYGSKAGVLSAFLRSTVQSLLADVDAAVRVEDGPTAQLRDLVYAHVRYQIRFAEQYGARGAAFGFNQLVMSLTPEDKLVINDLSDQHVKRMDRILSDGIASDEFVIADLTIATRAILTMADSVIEWFDPRGRLSADDVASYYAQLALNMVRSTADASAEPLEVSGGSRDRA